MNSPETPYLSGDLDKQDSRICHSKCFYVLLTTMDGYRVVLFSVVTAYLSDTTVCNLL